MPIRVFKCVICQEEFPSKKPAPLHCDTPATELLVPASVKFLEKTDADKNKTQLAGQQKILKERARAHSRDVETIDLIEKNPIEEAKKNKWIREDGRPRKKIDDL